MYKERAWQEASGALTGTVMLRGIKITKYPDGVITIYDCFNSSFLYPELEAKYIKVINSYGWFIGVNKVVVMKSNASLNAIKEEIRKELLNKHNIRRIKSLKEKREEIIILRRNALNSIAKRTR